MVARRFGDQMAPSTVQQVTLSTQESRLLPEPEKVGSTPDLSLLVFRHRMCGLPFALLTYPPKCLGVGLKI